MGAQRERAREKRKKDGETPVVKQQRVETTRTATFDISASQGCVVPVGKI